MRSFPRGRPLSGLAAAFLALLCISAGAQDPAADYSQVTLSGPVQQISLIRLKVQGHSFAMTEGTVLKGLDGEGRAVDLKILDFPPSAQATVFAQGEGEHAVAAAVFRGQSFLLRGTVTKIEMDGEGFVSQLTVDRRFDVRVAEVDSTWGEGESVPEDGSDEVDEGDEITLLGIVRDGSFTAIYALVTPPYEEFLWDQTADRPPSCHGRPLRPRPRPASGCERGLRPRA